MMAAFAPSVPLSYFASMLDYPDASLPETSAACAAMLDYEGSEAAHLVQEFASYAMNTPLSKIEEAYTSVFDLDPKCALYIGYHLFGESYKRSVFLLGLNERFDAHLHTPPGEVPDHLTVVLRCLANAPDDESAQELIADAVLPALDRMTGRIKAPDLDEPPSEMPAPDSAAAQRAPFVDLLEALRLVLRDAVPDLDSREPIVIANSSFIGGSPCHG